MPGMDDRGGSDLVNQYYLIGHAGPDCVTCMTEMCPELLASIMDPFPRLIFFFF